MVIAKPSNLQICVRCLYRQSAHSTRCRIDGNSARGFSHTAVLPQQNVQIPVKDGDHTNLPEKTVGQVEEPGGMSRRLAQLTDDSIQSSGRGAEKAIQHGGFSEELKRRLERRLLDSSFKSENRAAFAQVNMPASAGRGTRDIAGAQPWSGTENLEDAALRMLNDAHKPLRGTGSHKVPVPRVTPMSVDMRMKKAMQRTQGQRLANARDRTSAYSLSQDLTLSEKEREQMRRSLKERFTAGARPMPGSVQGLAALANERIEDAISRGQFKNIPRGKGKNVERDYNANSPFLDTTEYFMNKIIQKQEIVPPWIEKQQELVKSAGVFRTRIRKDWRRHAARVIASKGGGLEAQVRRAEGFAVAEAASNPKSKKIETMTEIDHEGRLSQLTVTETPTLASDTSNSHNIVAEELVSSSPTSSDAQAVSVSTDISSQATTENVPPTPSTKSGFAPFRDPAWESLELPYHSLAIKELNNLTRTYNLQAPNLAKKPYFSLDRELRSCFADVAPQLPNEIKERARRPEKIRVESAGHRPGGILERFSTDGVKVYDSRKPKYGFKQFWHDLWGGQEAKA